MLTIDEMKKVLSESIPGKRYRHSMAVYETALLLADEHGLATDKIAVAALLHDCGRETPSKESVAKARKLGLPIDPVELAQPILLHAEIGVYNAVHKYGVEDEEILDGIRFHTTGAADMTDLAKIVFLADMVEPGRDFPGVDELRKLACKDLDKAMLHAYGNTLRYLLEQGQLIHPRCIAGYNQLCMEKKERREKE